MQAVDHVIIGTGINALVAGALLARKGKKVLLLERETRVGGCMMTAEATLPGFRHDVMAATFVLFITSPAYAELAGDLARHGLEFCHTPHPTAVLRPDGRATVLGMDRAANVAAFNGLAPGDGTGTPPMSAASRPTRRFFSPCWAATCGRARPPSCWPARP
ncbi:MAG: phytoene desaturase family protein, partial [Pseudodonghicola sp.]